MGKAKNKKCMITNQKICLYYYNGKIEICDENTSQRERNGERNKDRGIYTKNNPPT
jgi:hypothetical protein